MGKSIPVEVQGKLFANKTALTLHMRELIGRYRVGAWLSPEDTAFCLALFRFHPDVESKFGPGIDRIEVRLDEYRNKHFQVHRRDGTNEDISWVYCIRHAA